MSTNDRDPAAGIAAQCAGNRYDNKQWRQANGRIYAGIHFVDPAQHFFRNEVLCLPDSERGGEGAANAMLRLLSLRESGSYFSPFPKLAIRSSYMALARS